MLRIASRLPQIMAGRIFDEAPAIKTMLPMTNVTTDTKITAVRLSTLVAVYIVNL
jgi:hypothetical protein